jgi:hypothetical protein
MSKNFNKFVLLIVFLAIAYFGYTRYRHKIMQYIPPSFQPEGSSHQVIYDTDPQNDRFIRGTLNGRQLRVLDQVLNEEERNGGMRISNANVRKIALDDKAIIEAYDRWRRCVSLMRSENYVVYPSRR